VAAQETGEGENTAEAENLAPKTILGRVAAVLGLDEATVEDAFQQARKDQKTEAYRDKLDRQVENGRITSEEAEEQFIWFQSRPDSLAGSFRQGGRQRPGFGHVMSFEGKRFGMRMHRRGGRWAGPDFSSSGWTPRRKRKLPAAVEDNWNPNYRSGSSAEETRIKRETRVTLSNPRKLP